MGSDNRRVHHQCFVIWGILEVFKEFFPDAFLRPAFKTGVHGPPFSVHPRQQPPLAATAAHIKNSINEAPDTALMPKVDSRNRPQNTKKFFPNSIFHVLWHGVGSPLVTHGKPTACSSIFTVSYTRPSSRSLSFKRRISPGSLP